MYAITAITELGQTTVFTASQLSQVRLFSQGPTLGSTPHTGGQRWQEDADSDRGRTPTARSAPWDVSLCLAT